MPAGAWASVLPAIRLPRLPLPRLPWSWPTPVATLRLGAPVATLVATRLPALVTTLRLPAPVTTLVATRLPALVTTLRLPAPVATRLPALVTTLLPPVAAVVPAVAIPMVVIVAGEPVEVEAPLWEEIITGAPVIQRCKAGLGLGGTRGQPHAGQP